MIDPVTAFVAAQAAVASIQKAIKLGKDINGLVGEFGKFFDAKDVVQKAANDKAKIARVKASAQRVLAAQIIGAVLTVSIMGGLLIMILKQIYED